MSDDEEELGTPKEASSRRLRPSHWLNSSDISIVSLVIAFASSVALAAVVLYGIYPYILLPTDPTSARYMLSALVQSEAAILAIVITLSLVAVQLTASSYSPRVIDIFKKSPHLWLVLCLYTIGIAGSLLVLKAIEGDGSTPLPKGVELGVVGFYLIGVLCLLALFPYTLSVFRMLKPATIIDELAKNITKESLLKGVSGEGDDPVQPIVDVVVASMEKHDHESVKRGLDVIEEHICGIFEGGKATKEEADKILEKVCNYFESVGVLSLRKNNVRSAVDTVDAIGRVGIAVTKREYGESGKWAVMAIEHMGSLSLELIPGWGAAVFTKAVQNLSNMGKALVNNLNAIGLIVVLPPMLQLARKAAEKGYGGGLGDIANRFKDICDVLLNKIIEKTIPEGYMGGVIQPLGELGVLCIKKPQGGKGAEDVAVQISVWLDEIKRTAESEGFVHIEKAAKDASDKIDEALKKNN